MSLSCRPQADAVIIGTPNLPPGNSSLEEVIKWAKANRHLMSQSEMGRSILYFIDSGNHKRLKRRTA